MSDETFLSTVFNVTVPQLPDEKKKSSLQMLNVIINHMKERWCFATCFFFSLMIPKYLVAAAIAVDHLHGMTLNSLTRESMKYHRRAAVICDQNSKLICGTACSQQALRNAMIGLINETNGRLKVKTCR